MSRVLITGASGVLGTRLAATLRATLFAREVVSLVRRAPRSAQEVWWDPAAARIDLARCEGFDAVVHLAGENVGSGEGLLAFTGRWTASKKHAILESRRQGTALLARSLAALKRPPRVLVSASGVGFYGAHAGAGAGGAGLDEAAPRGAGFLAEVAEAWEGATAPAAAAGVRVVQLRFGAILAGSGGVVEKLRLPFSLCLGGPIGSGQQWMPWVALEDAVRAVQHAIVECVRAGRAFSDLCFVSSLCALLQPSHRPIFFPRSCPPLLTARACRAP